MVLNYLVPVWWELSDSHNPLEYLGNQFILQSRVFIFLYFVSQLSCSQWTVRWMIRGLLCTIKADGKKTAPGANDGLAYIPKL